MKARRIGSLLALTLLPGCHRITGYGENTYSEGTVRHLASLDLAYRTVIVLSILAVVVGAYLVVYRILKPDRYDGSQLFWGAALVVIALVFTVRMYLNFSLIESCC